MHAPSVNQLASVRNLFLPKFFDFLSFTHLIKQITLEKKIWGLGSSDRFMYMGSLHCTMCTLGSTMAL